MGGLSDRLLEKVVLIEASHLPVLTRRHVVDAEAPLARCLLDIINSGIGGIDRKARHGKQGGAGFDHTRAFGIKSVNFPRVATYRVIQRGQRRPDLQRGGRAGLEPLAAVRRRIHPGHDDGSVGESLNRTGEGQCLRPRLAIDVARVVAINRVKDPIPVRYHARSRIRRHADRTAHRDRAVRGREHRCR